MDRYIKVDGVCIGMSKAEAWDILKNKGYSCNPSCLSSKGTTLFAGINVTVSFSFDNLSKISKIFLLWDKKRELDDKNKNLDTAFAALSTYFSSRVSMKSSESMGFSKRRTFIDLYNNITIYKQDSRDDGSPKYECVTVDIKDFIFTLDDKDKDLVEYARNSFIQRCNNLTLGTNEGKESLNISIKKKSITNTIKVLVLILCLGLFYMIISSYRYETFRDKGKYMRYDKWEQIYEKYDQHSKKWIRNY